MQASRSTSMAPNGAPAGSAITRCGTGACGARWSSARPSAVRLSPEGANVAGTRGASGRGHVHKSRSSAVGARAVDDAEMLALVAQRVGDRVADRHLECAARRGTAAPRCRSRARRPATRPTRARRARCRDRPRRRDAPRPGSRAPAAPCRGARAARWRRGPPRRAAGCRRRGRPPSRRSRAACGSALPRSAGRGYA